MCVEDDFATVKKSMQAALEAVGSASAWLADLEVEYKEEKETLLEEIQVLRMEKLELQVLRDGMRTNVEELNKLL